MKVQDDIKAVHFEGGNYFDDIRIDIAESHRRFKNISRHTVKVKNLKFRNLIKLYFTRIALRLNIYEFFVMNGISRRWLSDFKKYWAEILNGRPFWNTLDFFMLLYDYRKRQQESSQLEWTTPSQHLSNWQQPKQIYSTLHSVRVCAENPIRCLELWKKVSKGMYILEYGCSLAPYYYCYHEFFSHLKCKWVLADIPNFPFHYAKYLYRNDPDLEFITINENDFLNPLKEVTAFDVIILTTVFEHLDNPLFVAEYLLKRLKKGGLFVFDYIKSEGKGLDHPKSLEMRTDCLKYILDKTNIIYGKIKNINESIGLCIGQKKDDL